ncbi:MAG TPA: response regulator [Aliidongia sp.]|nr:response regulator [Aliidongia sp.]
MGVQEPMNILLVDDQPAKLLSYEAILKDLGETLLKADSARTALEMLLRNDVAVILVDVCMPDLDGFELAQMIRQHPRYQHTPIIFISAIQVTDLDLVRGYAEGAVDYVPVPVAPELLRAKVRVFTDLRRKTRQLQAFNAELEQRVADRTAELAQANAALESHNLELERRVEERTREYEATLNRINQMNKLESLGQLTGGVAHDFNNILMGVLGQLDVLSKFLPDDEPKAQLLLQGAIKSAERGTNLTKRMLAFARQQNLQPEVVEAGTLIHNMLDMLSRALGPAHQIVTDFPVQLAICVDANQFELALLNLALNARDAMPSGGTITIAGRHAQLKHPPLAGAGLASWVKISVRDNGSGMDEATLKRAAEPFFTTKDVGKGTGLGLSMVDGLLAQSSGFMRLESQVGLGTAVEMYFPSAKLSDRSTADSAPAASGHPAAGGSHYRVLIVDDDQLVRDSTLAMLEDLGHEVVSAASAAEALQLLGEGLIVDCVITDHAMPEMTGAQLVQVLERKWPALPVIVATGYADAAELKAQNVRRLAKPYRQQTLSALLAQVAEPPGQASR